MTLALSAGRLHRNSANTFGLSCRSHSSVGTVISKPCSSDRHTEGVPAAEWSAMMHANVVGNALLVQAVLPGMRRRGWGRIVFVSSGIGEEGVPGPGAYGTAKMALHGMARALAWEAGKDGILVNVAVAGLTITGVRPFPPELLDRLAARTPSRRLSTADDMAALILFLGSEANRNLTGEVIRDGSNAGRSAHAL